MDGHKWSNKRRFSSTLIFSGQPACKEKNVTLRGACSVNVIGVGSRVSWNRVAGDQHWG